MRQLKQSLALEASSSGNDTVQERKNKKKLLSWLKNTPVYLTLQWFDVVEEAKVSSNLLSRRWTTEITERDKLFLEKLGGGYLPFDVLGIYYTIFRIFWSHRQY